MMSTVLATDLPPVVVQRRGIAALSLRWFVALLVATSHVGVGHAQDRVTSVASARLRQAASIASAVQVELSLGTPLTVIGEISNPALWYQVKTVAGRTGWILGALTAPLIRGHEAETIEAIATARFAVAAGNHTFNDDRQLVELIERELPMLADREIQGRFALLRLRAVGRVLDTLPSGRELRPPFGPWVHAHEDALTYDESGGGWAWNRWFLSSVHQTFHDAAVDDDLAWFVVEHAVLGECEGNVLCYLEARDGLEGEYLREHPRGAHVDAVVGRVTEALNGVMDNLERFPAVLAEFNPKSGCAALSGDLYSVEAAVRASASTRVGDALRATERYRALCK